MVMLVNERTDLFRDVALAAIGGAGPFQGDLTHLRFSDLLDLFVCLESPGEAEMSGEYSAQMLAGANPLISMLGDISVNNPALGFWVGKAFSGRGRGYNYFRRFGRIVRSQPMATRVGPSRFDRSPCFQLHYGAFVSACGVINMVDEVRRVRPGLYLGWHGHGRLYALATPNPHAFSTRRTQFRLRRGYRNRKSVLPLNNSYC